MKRTKWGDWTFDSASLSLVHGETDYHIDLTGIHSSAAMLDWIFQIQAKGWASAATVHDLLSALDDVLDPQANYCSNEQDLRPDAESLAREYAAR